MLFDKIKLEDEEKVLKVIRKHWFIPFIELFGIAIMSIIPLLIIIILSLAQSQGWTDFAWTEYIALIIFSISLWFILCIMISVMIWTHYYLDLWILTDRRLIIIEQLGFFNRKVSHFRLERLQDIKVQVSGIIATLLKFGTIRAQTASVAESSFKMSGLPDPRELQSVVQTAMDNRINRIENAQYSRNF